MDSDTDGDEPSIFLRPKVENNSNDDDGDKWDDNDLIKNYDKAIHKARHQILRKVQKELQLTNEDVEGVLSDNPTSNKKKNTKKKHKKRGKLPVKWEVGDACRAIYSEDGEEYEAEIIEMIDGHWCKVKYLGYDNEEEILMSELFPSLGGEVIKLQIRMAQVENEEEELMKAQDYEAREKMQTPPKKSGKKNKNGLNHERRGVGHTHSQQQSLEQAMDTEVNQADCMKIPPLTKSEHKKKLKNANVECWRNDLASLQRQPMFDYTYPPNLPPPIPPANMSHCNNSGSDPFAFVADHARNQMLLSWFNCGYHTGYYERVLEENKRGK